MEYGVVYGVCTLCTKDEVEVWNPITGSTISESRGPTLTSLPTSTSTPDTETRPIALPDLVSDLFISLLLLLLLLLILLLLPLYYLLLSFPWCAGYAEIRGSFFYLFAIPFRQCHSFYQPVYRYITWFNCAVEVTFLLLVILNSIRFDSTQLDTLSYHTIIPTRPSMPDPARMKIHTYIHLHIYVPSTEYIRST